MKDMTGYDPERARARDGAVRSATAESFAIVSAPAIPSGISFCAR
jgi:hypothetical protein